MMKMVNMNDAELDDLYVDGDGKLWRVIALHGEPTVHLEEIEAKASDNRVVRSGGVSGMMWFGFERIYRPKPKPEPPERFLSIRKGDMNIREYVDNYRFEFGDGCIYTPDSNERAMLEDALEGYLASISSPMPDLGDSRLRRPPLAEGQ